MASARATGGAELAEYRDLVRAFLDSLRHVGAFDRLLADGMLLRLPLRTRVAVVTVRATAYIAGRGGVKPISKLELAGKELDQTKAAAIIVVSDVVSDELAHSTTSEAQQLFRRELQAASCWVG